MPGAPVAERALPAVRAGAGVPRAGVGAVVVIEPPEDVQVGLGDILDFVRETKDDLRREMRILIAAAFISGQTIAATVAAILAGDALLPFRVTVSYLGL